MRTIAVILMLVFAAAAVPAFADEIPNTQIKKMLDNQEQILKALDEIKAELQVVKIRASQH